jgi:ankyrin repeat protein
MCLLGCVGHAESVGGEPVEVADRSEVYTHAVVRHPVVFTAWAGASDDRDREEAVWEFELTVDKGGTVVNADLKSGPTEQRQEAKQTAMALRFKPFERDGRAVPARFPFYVQGKPEDYTGPTERSFPAMPHPEEIYIALGRTGCFGGCPDYRVELSGDGEVNFQGNAYVLGLGEHRWHVDPKAVADLLDRFRRADYLHLKGYYEFEESDVPTYITAISVGSTRKFVRDYGGSGMGRAVASVYYGGDDPHMPPIVTELEDAIDEVAGTASWVRGDENTIAKLHAAHWDFHSNQAGLALLLAIDACKSDLAEEFIREGAPVDVENEERGAAIAITGAVRCGNLGLVKLLESKGALSKEKDAKAFLEASVRSGYPEMARIALKHFPNAKITTGFGEPLIARAAHASNAHGADSGDAKFDPAEVVALLLDAGADANASDKDGDTALHKANCDSVVRLLIKAGANVNATNRAGQTPLFNPYFGEPKAALIQAGADLKKRDKRGRTALFDQQYATSANVLIKAGLNVNAADLTGQTPLEVAPREEVALALLDAGARLPRDPEHLKKLTARATKMRWTKVLPRLGEAIAARNLVSGTP